jgi:pyruvate ferredoxin oxidoreductase beta subunit
MTEIPKEEFILKCTSACAGCSSSLSLRYVLKAAGADSVLVVPACCTSVIQGMYPRTAVNIPVYNIAFAAAAACASGMSAAYQKKGASTNVIVYAGDGGTVDIGLQALSGAFERETNFLYICYDNEAYGNTGMQRSGSTPLGAITTTTPGGKVHAKKDIDRIVEAHNPPYMATACSSYPLEKSVEVGKLAVKTGAWILWEREHGTLRISGPSRAAIKKPLPLEEYLKIQGRFRTITPAQVQELQRAIDQAKERISCEVKNPCP